MPEIISEILKSGEYDLPKNVSPYDDQKYPALWHIVRLNIQYRRDIEHCNGLLRLFEESLNGCSQSTKKRKLREFHKDYCDGALSQIEANFKREKQKYLDMLPKAEKQENNNKRKKNH